MVLRCREDGDVGIIGIGIPNWLCAVLPPFSRVAAIPDDALTINGIRAALNAANTVFKTYIFSPTSKKRHLNLLSLGSIVATISPYTYLCSALKVCRH